MLFIRPLSFCAAGSVDIKRCITPRCEVSRLLCEYNFISPGDSGREKPEILPQHFSCAADTAALTEREGSLLPVGTQWQCGDERQQVSVNSASWGGGLPPSSALFDESLKKSSPVYTQPEVVAIQIRKNLLENVFGAYHDAVSDCVCHTLQRICTK